MGYWNQRKKARKINIAIKASLVLITSVFVLIFINFNNNLSFFLEKTILHIFAFSIFLLVISLYYKLITFSIVSFALSIVAFTYLNSNANLFFSENSNSANKLSIVFAKDAENLDLDNAKFDIVAEGHIGNIEETIVVSNLEVLKEGVIGLSPNHYAYYSENVISNNKEVMFIGLSFSKLSYNEAKVIYKNLAEFIVGQNQPVIIYGDFGLPAWSKVFKKFLYVTSLEVKNKIILTDMVLKYNPLLVPSINVLGYKYMGLEDIKFLPKKEKPYYPIMFSITL